MLDKKSQKALLQMPWLAAPGPKHASVGLEGPSKRCAECEKESNAAQACGNKACKLSDIPEWDAVVKHAECVRAAPACAHQRVAWTACRLERCDWAKEAVARLASRYNLKNIDAVTKDASNRREHAAAVAVLAKELLSGCRTEAGRQAARTAVMAKAEPRLAKMAMAKGSDKARRREALEAAFRPDAALQEHLRSTAGAYVKLRDGFARQEKALVAFRAKAARTDVKARLVELKAAACSPAR